MKAGIEPYVLADENCLEYTFVKAADRLAAYLKCIEETSRGNTEFTKAQKSIEKELHASKMPEMEYFFEKFVPSYKLTLDDLEGF